MESSELKRSIGQLMIVGFDGKTPSKEIVSLIEDYNIGGIILFARNIGTPKEVLTLTTQLQQIARRSGHSPLLICVDQENGIVRRLGTGATVFPGAMLLGATGRSENAYLIGLATARELIALGINWNLAPVVDVNNNPDNPVIGVRAFGEDPDKVTEFGRAAIRGMKQGGVITTLKHFPGHGDTSVDSHLAMPIIKHSLERLEKLELIPYKAIIKGYEDVIMTSHVYFPALEKEENRPATMSKAIITGLLREKLGYNGVITTDCMEMDAIKKTIGTIKGGVEAIKAGVDLIMVSHTIELQIGTIEAIYSGVVRGEIEDTLILNALERVKKLKNKFLSWEDISKDSFGEALKIVGSEEHRELAEDIYKQGLTIHRNDWNLLPLSLEDRDVLLICPNNTNLVRVEDTQYSNCSLDIGFKSVNPHICIEKIKDFKNVDEINLVLERARSYTKIIVGTLSISSQREQGELIKRLSDMGKQLIVVAMKSPYDIMYIPKVAAYIATYEYTYPALVMAARAVYGLDQVTGRTPVTIDR